MHIRYQRAAVAVDGPTQSDEDCQTNRGRNLFATKPSRPLWASQTLPVRAGRLIGVRLRGEDVEVALMKPGAEGLRWVAARTALSEQQERLWLTFARFAP